MLENFEKAAEYYYKRAFFKVDGFEQEKFDALFEFTRISIYQLKKPWKQFEKYYELCIEWQPTRPEGNYFLGIHYFLDGILNVAFDHFKKAHQIGFPAYQQYSLKPTINYIFTIKFKYNNKPVVIPVEPCAPVGPVAPVAPGSPCAPGGQVAPLTPGTPCGPGMPLPGVLQHLCDPK